MLWRYSWYLQQLKYDGKQFHIFTFTIFLKYSWYLQRLKYDGKQYLYICNAREVFMVPPAAQI